MSDHEIVERLRAYREELLELVRQDQSEIRKVSTVIEDLDGALEGDW